MEYKKRIADQILTDKLDSSGDVLVEGSKEIRREGRCKKEDVRGKM